MSPSLLIAPKGGREIASSRYRIHDLLPLLGDLGWRVAVLTPSMSRRGRLGNALRDLERSANSWDVLFVQRPGRRREEALILRLAVIRARVVAVDVDDPVDEIGPFAWVLRRADLIVTGSRWLESAYAGRARRVEYLPTSLEVSRYEFLRTTRATPVAGWLGDGPSYRESLVRLVAGAAAADGWVLRIVGTCGNDRLEGELRAAAGLAPIELVPRIEWEDEDAVASELSRFDVGLAPFRSVEGGSFKTVQYLAAGVIPLAESGGEAERHARSALGAAAAVVRPGDRGAIAEALRSLSCPDRRAELSARCRQAARRYSREAAAVRLDALLRASLADAS